MGITRTTNTGGITTNNHSRLTSESNPTVATSTTNQGSTEIIQSPIPISDEEAADRFIKEHLCSIGKTLEEYLALNTQHNNDDLGLNLNSSLHNNGTHHQSEDFGDLLGHNTDIVVNTSVCERQWDGILCWPDTLIGHTATLSCFSDFNGIQYDSSKNATRFCDEAEYGQGGTWNATSYDLCFPISPTTQSTNDSDILALTTTVYFFGYCLSLATCTIAMIIFLAFKELRCTRNTIHTQLIITYILADTMWIITSSTTFTSASSSFPDAQVQQPGSGGGQTQVSCVTYILLHYFHLTNFFFMFVEGLYLYVLVVQTFAAKNIKLRVYLGIGWGLPLAVVFAWAIAKWLAHPEFKGTPNEIDMSCPWLEMNAYDWIYKGPVILTLAANSIFLLQIMFVLITKLRSATNPETQQSMKTAKALAVLMPLLGITYLLMLAGSREAYYEFTRALLISTQGFLVALLYCFLNGEVRKALRHRFNRLNANSSCDCCPFGRSRRMRDWSPRTRTESIRLYNSQPSTHPFRKRGSSTSEATSMTTINTHSAVSSVNGSHHRLSTAFLANKFHTSPLKEEAASVNTFI